MFSNPFSLNHSSIGFIVKDSSFINMIKDESDLLYNLEIVQNPTRARATGWGSKGKLVIIWLLLPRMGK